MAKYNIYGTKLTDPKIEVRAIWIVYAGDNKKTKVDVLIYDSKDGQSILVEGDNMPPTTSKKVVEAWVLKEINLQFKI